MPRHRSPEPPPAGPDAVAPHRRADTGIRNAGRLLAAATKHTAGTVLVLDIDGMGAVNRRWGTDLGDQLLAAVDTALRRAVVGRGGATAFGGDQFLVVVTGRHRPAAVVRELRRTVHRVRIGRARVTASAGCCSWVGTSPSAGALLAAAAASLARAKRH